MRKLSNFTFSPAFLAVLLAGCVGSGNQLIRALPTQEQFGGDPHPLSPVLLGHKGLARAMSCGRLSKNAEDQDEFLRNCFNPIGPPHYSLSLSGGGYRATLFHYGAMKQLNDAGRLRDLKVICSVSGGSITAAALVSQWDKLEFDSFGVASNLDDVVGAELMKLTSKTIDSPVVAGHIITLGALGSTIVPALDRSALFQKRSLRSLPNSKDSPLLVMFATDIARGRLFAMSRDVVGPVENLISGHDMSLPQAIAASSSFPPILGPIRFRLQYPKKVHQLYLVDGGIIDNLGLAFCSRSQSHYVSDAANPLQTSYDSSNWISSTYRSIDLIHSSSSERFKRSACAAEGRVCWSLSDTPQSTALSEAEIDGVMRTARVPTRLKGLSAREQCALVTAGYLSAQESLAIAGQSSASSKLPCPLEPEVVLGHQAVTH